MKDRLNSENNLKKAFDSYQAPIDNEAFAKFKNALDKKEKDKKFIWWIFFGKMSIPLLGLGMALLLAAIVHLNNDDNATQISSDTLEVDASPVFVDSSNSGINDKSDLSATKAKNENAEIAFKSKSISDKKSNESRTIRKEQSKPEGETPTAITDAQISSDLMPSQNIITTNQKPDPNSKTLQDVPKPTLEGIDLLNILDPSLIARINDDIEDDQQVTPYAPPYESHFYFTFGVGRSSENTHSPSNDFLTKLKTSELIWQGSLAYQFNKNTSLELSLLHKNISTSIGIKDHLYKRKTGKKINILKVGMVNRVCSFGSKIDLNMSLGLSTIIASKSFNDNLDFESTTNVESKPGNINGLEFEWEGLYSGPHILYTTGLALDYELSHNVALSFGANYTLGFKPIMRESVKFLINEGIVKRFETQSNSSFGSFNIGIKYRMRRK